MRRFIRLLLMCLALLILTAGSLHAVQASEESILLVARKGMRDPYFSQTVLLLTNHGRRGTIGVILNRPMQTPLKGVFPDNRALQKEPDPLYFGGPVSVNTMVFVFRGTANAEEALHIFDDVYMSMSPEVLSRLLQRAAPTRDLRVFRGYAGWAAGQLKAEIARGDWHVLKADPQVIFSKAPEKLWQEMIIRATALQAKASPQALIASLDSR